jgi:hypothetical protein
MADVEYSVEARFEGDTELRRAGDSFERLGDSGRRALGDIEQKARGGLGLLNLEAGISVVGQAFGALQSVAGAALGALTEGAALSDARGDFADLTAEINTTADAMETRLREATGGLVANAQLVADASNLMGLNLGLTEDEIVGFAGAAAELDWNMEALADTLNTGATRGLKEMGLSIADVKGRMAELEAQGVATDKAFRMAILEAAEEKIGRVGRKSEEAAGQIQIMETAIVNASETFKEAFAGAVVEQLEGAAGGALELGRNLDYAAAGAAKLVAIPVGGFLDTVSALGQVSVMGTLATEIIDLGGNIDDIRRKWPQAFTPGRQTPESVAGAIAGLSAELANLQTVAAATNPELNDIFSSSFAADADKATDSIIRHTDALAAFNQASNQDAYTVPVSPTLDQAYYSYLAAGARDFNQAIIDQMTYARGAATAWEEYTDAISSRGGDLFADFIEEAGRASEAGKQWAFDLNQAIFDAANNEGAGADFLGGFAENIGAAAEDIAAAMQAAQQQSLVTDLAAGVREAGISWSEFPGIVEQAMAELEGTTARPPIIRPELDEIGFRREMENSLPDTNEPVVVPMEIQIQEDLINTAVENARGIVQGFTNPAEVYQAVMEMDISAIETGSATATQLIRGVPTSKTITINWKETGGDIVEALRALGVIP